MIRSHHAQTVRTIILAPSICWLPNVWEVAGKGSLVARSHSRDVFFLGLWGLSPTGSFCARFLTPLESANPADDLNPKLPPRGPEPSRQERRKLPA
jgi:hypothetical protein